MQINLSMEEAKMLREVLDHYASDLRMQISKTEQLELREDLKKAEQTLQCVINQIDAGETSTLRQ
jgi:hypothetical protein